MLGVIARRPGIGWLGAERAASRRREVMSRRYATGTIRTENASFRGGVAPAVLGKRVWRPELGGVKAEEFCWSNRSFEQLKVNQTLQNALLASEINRPTLIQELVIPAVLSEQYENVVFADQTGTGKTLAYLLPTLQLIKEHEKARSIPNGLSRPEMVILAPSRELSAQVGRVVKTLSHWLKVRSATVVGGSKLLPRAQKRVLRSPIDVVATTPGTLLEHWRRKRIYFSKLRYVVIDEMDTMMLEGAGFVDDVQNLLSSIKTRLAATGERAQFIYAGATVTEDFLNAIGVQSSSTKSKFILSPFLHTVTRRLDQRWIDVAGDKQKRLLTILREVAQPGERVMIFCNTIASCRYVDRILTENSFKSSCYHGTIPSDVRSINYDAYARGERPIMVCTDLASRGLDLQGTNSVILFDFPLNAIDYIHRVGRTARAGGAGKVFNLIMKKDRVLASKIKHALASREPLEGLTSTKTHLSQTREKPSSDARA